MIVGNACIKIILRLAIKAPNIPAKVRYKKYFYRVPVCTMSESPNESCGQKTVVESLVGGERLRGGEQAPRAVPAGARRAVRRAAAQLAAARSPGSAR